jgi:hypothetical protein
VEEGWRPLRDVGDKQILDAAKLQKMFLSVHARVIKHLCPAQFALSSFGGHDSVKSLTGA